MKIQDSIAIVTGGASGLGEATVRNIVRNGGMAAILDLGEAKGNRLAEELGENAIFIKTDVTSDEDVQNAINVTLQQLGPFNTVINCAGIGLAEKTVSKNKAHDYDHFKKVIQVNLIGTFNVIRLAAEKLVTFSANEEGERGVIINTASVAAFDGQIGQAAYSASKGGVVGMTLPIARDLAKNGIRVVTIAPGLIETPLFGSLSEKAKAALEQQVPFPSRLGRPSEYAQLTQSIIENVMLNGETIRLDGAIRMSPK
ncbi:3-hydroxyacyl-CoA dehydrogenase [Neobacillus ginsengisoli]|uniref:NAD(P)-dependent dehydrogenase (Short-subunit alcohol dehydrogenase family) n=1 Tax=Neobacillus ginsengisoli TaxID=904295 RepID=A0ABT9Y0J6_9BACI|nr:3-hydroxyacyl-CoA dehydrogenase [Neobacillus ginsengisoli]MDQ0201351.1 NAD(P)-dependent dehydrogenase (short-subunit alcohol dehydrogenase family) [Neobacillus ginsengisoli]